MKSQPEFRQLIKKNKNKLLDAGINPWTLRSWMYGYRIPDLMNAARVSQVTGIKLQDIPYRQIIFNRP